MSLGVPGKSPLIMRFFVDLALLQGGPLLVICSVRTRLFLGEMTPGKPIYFRPFRGVFYNLLLSIP